MNERLELVKNLGSENIQNEPLYDWSFIPVAHRATKTSKIDLKYVKNKHKNYLHNQVDLPLKVFGVWRLFHQKDTI